MDLQRKHERFASQKTLADITLTILREWQTRNATASDGDVQHKLLLHCASDAFSRYANSEGKTKDAMIKKRTTQARWGCSNPDQ
eukprot:scaffold9239_cov19-Tisochrysis_lutea.AAC.1